MASNTSSTVRYWPMLATAILVLAAWAAIGYDHYYNADRKQDATVPLVVSWVVAALLGLALYFVHKQAGSPQSSRDLTPVTAKLTIHSAVWGTGPKNDRKVVETLQKLANGRLDVVIDNDLFGKPDPAIGDVNKRCEVEYSLGDGPRIKTSRPQSTPLRLPEDSYLLEQIERLQASMPSDSPPPGPDLKVEYRESSRGLRAALIFRVRKGSPVTIQKVGPLVSEELYRTENSFVLLQSVIPEVEIDHPVESQISFVRNEKSGELVALEDVLEAGGAGVTDSVLIEYAADGQHFSRRYYLHKNADGSIVWSAESRQPEPKDLRVLRGTLRSLHGAFEDLTFVGRPKGLEQDSLSLESQLSDILDTATEGTDLGHPFRIETISLNLSEALLPLLERLRLMSFRDRYTQFEEKCRSLHLHRNPAVPNLPTLPNEFSGPEILQAISKHRNGLNEIAAHYTRQYAASFFGLQH